MLFKVSIRYGGEMCLSPIISKPGRRLAMILMILVSCAGQSASITPEKDSKKIETNLQPTAQPLPEKSYRKGEVIVRFEKNVDKDRIESMLKQMGLEIVHTYTIPDLYLLTITSQKTVEETLEILHDHPEVMYAEPNYTIQLNR